MTDGALWKMLLGSMLLGGSYLLYRMWNMDSTADERKRLRARAYDWALRYEMDKVPDKQGNMWGRGE